MNDTDTTDKAARDFAGQRSVLSTLFQAAIRAVQGDHSTAACIAHESLTKPTHILAVGKAAASMLEGVPTDWATALPVTLVTKRGHLPAVPYGPNVTAIESDHPVPSAVSLHAGDIARRFVAGLGPSDHLLCLVSGGASALVEDLQDGVTLSDLIALTGASLAAGDDIATINAKRRAVSRIKGGKLLGACHAGQIDVIAISDVEGDHMGVIGSGIGAAGEGYAGRYRGHIAGSNAVARAAVADAARSAGIEVVTSTEAMFADLNDVADRIARAVQDGPDGLYIFGGEPTVVLPPRPGQGGRNQALALALALRFRGDGRVTGLVAGTDGTDGPTEAAGGFFDHQTAADETGARHALATADSGTYLGAMGDLLVTGPTGTNVMDLALVLKSPS